MALTIGLEPMLDLHLVRFSKPLLYHSAKSAKILVLPMGVEPIQAFAHRSLSSVCLPISSREYLVFSKRFELLRYKALVSKTSMSTYSITRRWLVVSDGLEPTLREVSVICSTRLNYETRWKNIGTSVRSRTLNFGFGDQCVPFYTTEILASGRGLEPLNVGVKVPCAYQFHHPDI